MHVRGQCDPDGRCERGRSLNRRLGHADLGGVADVRRELRDLLRHWGGPGRADVAELLLSELVTNALVHTDRGAVVKASFDGDPGEGPRGAPGASAHRGPPERPAVSAGRLRVEVRDFVPRRAALRARSDGFADATGTSGRGLLLVNTLADAWGVCAHGVGKSVWFELEDEEGPEGGG
ncbi:ATP-binding protein [Streptomyces sp. LX-29]|uniref:ATP-binding protein n=1 Tax=Streptomyces sp. LX-29 TaxID=2900152 RepID=UPI00240D7128|nr:ATP-binding protein [Streptomyces sp. LX-29]WFB06872.1 ATP-binding protein [Streptomyces sp. LX-29]